MKLSKQNDFIKLKGAYSGEKTVITSEIEQFLKDRASIMISDERTVSESPFISKKENLKEKELRERRVSSNSTFYGFCAVEF